MNGTTLMDERMHEALEAEVRPLIATIRAALADLVFAPGDSVKELLAYAPADACSRLADVWTMATDLGLPTEQIKDRFEPEDQFLVELVTSVYSHGRSSAAFENHDFAELVRLLNETEPISPSA